MFVCNAENVRAFSELTADYIVTTNWPTVFQVLRKAMSGKGGQFSQSQDLCEMMKYKSPVAPLKGKLMAIF